MSQSSTAQPPLSGHVVRQPFDLTRYDRSQSLTSIERGALHNLVVAFDAKKFNWPENSEQTLARLLGPLTDVLDHIQMHRRSRVSAIRLMIRWMDSTQQSYWAWTQATWHHYLVENKRQGQVKVAHPSLLAFAYCLGGIRRFPHDYGVKYYHFASAIFGQDPVRTAVECVIKELVGWGYDGQITLDCVRRVLSVFLLHNGSADLAAIQEDILSHLDPADYPIHLYKTAANISRALVNLGILHHPLCIPESHPKEATSTVAQNISDVWVQWCQRWRKTSTLAPGTVESSYYGLLKVGRWLQAQHPEVTSPEQWTRDLAITFVAAVNRMTVGEYASETSRIRSSHGQPLSARSQVRQLWTVGKFFRDLQEWGWIARHFNPERCFLAPRSVIAQLTPNPRILDEALWAKLIWAGLNLQADDLGGLYCSAYPLEMVRAVAAIWLFSGLRSDEIRRLRLGCIRDGVVLPEEGHDSQATCLLDVPAHKTGGPFTKPVARLVGEAVRAWEQVRPHQPPVTDRRTGERVHLLFLLRGKCLGDTYINESLIPLLCHKTGIPRQDNLGRITSHRARATIATQLGNAREPMSLLELQQWLGHSSPLSTQHYVKVLPQRLTRAYADAGYLDRNIRAIEVLIDQDVIRSGATAAGEPWKYYDLGHGHCTYDFFDQCPHRMACARCDFYIPKDSAKAQLLQAKTNLLRMKQEIPLLDDELAALNEDVAAIDRLCSKLADVPSPSGQTPRQLYSTDIILFSEIG